MRRILLLVCLFLAVAPHPLSAQETQPSGTIETENNASTDAAIAAAEERARRVIPDLAHVRHAIDDADRQLHVARDVIAGHRGWIGADARTRLAEADRVRQDLDRLVGGSAATASDIAEDDREQAMVLSRRAATLAGESLQLAQRDIDSSRPPGGPDQWNGGWGGPQRGGRGGGDLMGGILGGLVIGGLLDGMFD